MTRYCETNEAFIYDRGGFTRIGGLTEVFQVTWERLRDDISTAQATVLTPSTQCCDLLREIEPGRHEMVIFRGQERVWEGPVHRVADSSANTVTVEAKDVMRYTQGTIIRNGYNDTYPNCRSVIERATLLMQTELARKEALSPPINVLPYLTPLRFPNPDDEPHECRVIAKYQKTLFEEIDSFAQYSGMDYVAVGRRVLLNSVYDEQIGRTQVVTENDFLGDVIVTAYGSQLATRSAATDGEGHYAWVGGIDSYYGEWERLTTIREEGESAQETPSRAALLDSARANLRGRNPVPTTVRIPENSQVNPAGILGDVSKLVPGVRIPLRATMTCRTLLQEQKLNRVLVSETGEGGETISVLMIPAPGTVPEEQDEGTDLSGGFEPA